MVSKSKVIGWEKLHKAPLSSASKAFGQVYKNPLKNSRHELTEHCESQKNENPTSSDNWESRERNAMYAKKYCILMQHQEKPCQLGEGRSTNMKKFYKLNNAKRNGELA